MKLERAVEEVKKLLVPVSAKYISISILVLSENGLFVGCTMISFFFQAVHAIRSIFLIHLHVYNNFCNRFGCSHVNLRQTLNDYSVFYFVFFAS